MIKKILKWSLLVALLGYLFFAGAWAREEAQKNACKDIEVVIEDGYATDSVTASGILAELNRYPHKIIGTPVSVIDTRAIENYLGLMSQFEHVVCNITTGGNLRVSVVPMVPEARVFDGAESYYINKEGKKMPSKATYFVEVPVIGGNFSDNFPAKSVLPVVRYIQADNVLSNLVGMIYARDPRNIYLVPRIQGHIINFGDTTCLDYKRDALIAFYKKVMPYKGWDTYDTISVKFHGQVVATRRDKNRPQKNLPLEEEIDMEESTLPEIL